MSHLPQNTISYPCLYTVLDIFQTVASQGKCKVCGGVNWVKDDLGWSCGTCGNAAEGFEELDEQFINVTGTAGIGVDRVALSALNKANQARMEALSQMLSGQGPAVDDTTPGSVPGTPKAGPSRGKLSLGGFGGGGGGGTSGGTSRSTQAEGAGGNGAGGGGIQAPTDKAATSPIWTWIEALQEDVEDMARVGSTLISTLNAASLEELRSTDEYSDLYDSIKCAEVAGDQIASVMGELWAGLLARLLASDWGKKVSDLTRRRSDLAELDRVFTDDVNAHVKDIMAGRVSVAVSQAKTKKDNKGKKGLNKGKKSAKGKEPIKQEPGSSDDGLSMLASSDENMGRSSEDEDDDDEDDDDDEEEDENGQATGGSRRRAVQRKQNRQRRRKELADARKGVMEKGNLAARGVELREKWSKLIEEEVEAKDFLRYGRLRFTGRPIEDFRRRPIGVLGPLCPLVLFYWSMRLCRAPVVLRDVAHWAGSGMLPWWRNGKKWDSPKVGEDALWIGIPSEMPSYLEWTACAMGQVLWDESEDVNALLSHHSDGALRPMPRNPSKWPAIPMEALVARFAVELQLPPQVALYAVGVAERLPKTLLTSEKMSVLPDPSAERGVAGGIIALATTVTLTNWKGWIETVGATCVGQSDIWARHTAIRVEKPWMAPERVDHILDAVETTLFIASHRTKRRGKRYIVESVAKRSARLLIDRAMILDRLGRSGGSGRKSRDNGGLIKGVRTHGDGYAAHAILKAWLDADRRREPTLNWPIQRSDWAPNGPFDGRFNMMHDVVGHKYDYLTTTALQVVSAWLGLDPAVLDRIYGRIHSWMSGEYKLPKK